MQINKDVTVTVVTVAYNSEKTIGNTITSVLQQTVLPNEYIIVDGKSTDKTVEIAKSFELLFYEQGVNYIVISECDEGIYDAMNKGLRIAKGELVGEINSDDQYVNTTIELVKNEYHKNSFDYCYGEMLVVINNGQKILKKAKNMNKIVSSRYWSHPTAFVKRSVLNNKYYNLKYPLYADFEMFLRLKKNNSHIVVINRPMAIFNFGGASTKPRISEAIQRAQERYTVYKDSGYSKFYIFECYLTEFAKYILGKI